MSMSRAARAGIDGVVLRLRVSPTDRRAMPSIRIRAQLPSG